MIRALRKRFDAGEEDAKQPLITPVGGPAEPPPLNYTVADSHPAQGAQ